MNFVWGKKKKVLGKEASRTSSSSTTTVNSSCSSGDSGKGSSSSVDSATQKDNKEKNANNGVNGSGMNNCSKETVVNDNDKNSLHPTTPTSFNSTSSSEVDYGPQGTIKRKGSMNRMNPKLPLKSTTTRILVQQTDESRVEVTQEDCSQTSPSSPMEVNGNGKECNPETESPFNRNNRIQYGTLRSRIKNANHVNNTKNQNEVKETGTTNGNNNQMISMPSLSSTETERMSVVSDASSFESGFRSRASAVGSTSLSSGVSNRLSSRCSSYLIPVSGNTGGGGPASDVCSLASSSQFVMEDFFDDEDDEDVRPSEQTDLLVLQQKLLQQQQLYLEDALLVDQLPLPPPPELLEPSSLSSSLSTLSLASLPPPPEFACESLKRIQAMTNVINLDDENNMISQESEAKKCPNVSQEMVCSSTNSSASGSSPSASPASSPGSSPSDHSYNNDADEEATLTRDPNHQFMRKKSSPRVNQSLDQHYACHNKGSQVSHLNAEKEHPHQDQDKITVIVGDIKTNCVSLEPSVKTVSFSSFMSASPAHQTSFPQSLQAVKEGNLELSLKQQPRQKVSNPGIKNKSVIPSTESKLDPGRKFKPMYSSSSSCSSTASFRDDASDSTIKSQQKEVSAEDFMIARLEADATPILLMTSNNDKGLVTEKHYNPQDNNIMMNNGMNANNRKANVMKKKILMAGGKEERIYDSVFTFRKSVPEQQQNHQTHEAVHSHRNGTDFSQHITNNHIDSRDQSQTSSSNHVSLIMSHTPSESIDSSTFIRIDSSTPSCNSMINACQDNEVVYASFHRPSRQQLRSPMKGPLPPPPQDFVRNLQKVMEKKWKVAQTLQADLSSFSLDQVIGLSDVSGLNGKVGSGQHQNQHNHHHMHNGQHLKESGNQVVMGLRDDDRNPDTRNGVSHEHHEEENDFPPPPPSLHHHNNCQNVIATGITSIHDGHHPHPLPQEPIQLHHLHPHPLPPTPNAVHSSKHYQHHPLHHHVVGAELPPPLPQEEKESCLRSHPLPPVPSSMNQHQLGSQFALQPHPHVVHVEPLLPPPTTPSHQNHHLHLQKNLYPNQVKPYFKPLHPDPSSVGVIHPHLPQHVHHQNMRQASCSSGLMPPSLAIPFKRNSSCSVNSNSSSGSSSSNIIPPPPPKRSEKTRLSSRQ